MTMAKKNEEKKSGFGFMTEGSPLDDFIEMSEKKDEAKPEDRKAARTAAKAAKAERTEPAAEQHAAAPAVNAYGEEEMLARPQRETNSKRVALNMPPSLYVKLYNRSVKANMSLNALMIQIFSEYVEEN